MIGWLLNHKECIEIIESLSVIGGSIAVIVTVFSFYTSRKQLHHGVMISCISRFQDIIPHLDDLDSEKKRDALRKYIDLCNEELFYFKGGYVPDEVAEEWLDGMITYMPLYDQEGKVISIGRFEEILESGMLDGYPRIRKAFRITRLPDLKNPDDRKNCILEIRQNLRGLKYPCA